MQIKYPLIDKLKTPGISAWKTHLRKPYTQNCTKEYLVLLSHCRTQKRQLSGQGCTQNIWQAGESPPEVQGQREVGALL